MYKHILPHKEKIKNSLINIEEEVAKLKKEINNLREGCKKIKWWNFPPRWVGGVSSGQIFCFFFVFFYLNISLKHWMLPSDHFQTHLWF